MKESRDHGSKFEERLLDELRAVVEERGAQRRDSVVAAARRPAWRRAPRLAVGAATVLVMAAALLVFTSGSDKTSRAFAVVAQEGGGVTISIYSPEDAAGLQAVLAEAGIRSQVNWLPAGMTCREPHFTPSKAKTSMGGAIGGMTVAGPAPAMTIGVMSAQQYRERWREFRRGELSEDQYHESTPNISLDPASFRPDQTVVISGSPGPYDGDPEGGYEAEFAVAEGAVEPCEPVRVPDGGSLGAMNRALESESAQASTRSNRR